MPVETFAWREEYILYLEERVKILEEFRSKTEEIVAPGIAEIDALRERLALERSINSELRSKLLKRNRDNLLWEIVKIGGAFALGTRIK